MPQSQTEGEAARIDGSGVCVRAPACQIEGPGTLYCAICETQPEEKRKWSS